MKTPKEPHEAFRGRQRPTLRDIEVYSPSNDEELCGLGDGICDAWTAVEGRSTPTLEDEEVDSGANEGVYTQQRTKHAVEKV